MSPKHVLFVFLLVALIPCSGISQKKPAWVEMSVRDAEKLLKDSPWAQTQSDTDTSELFFSPTKPGTASIAQTSTPRGTFNDQQSINNNRADRGATNEAVSVNYHIRFFSAGPIREAISRIVLLNAVEAGPAVINRMQTLVDRDFSDYIVVTVSLDSNDRRFMGPALQALAAATGDIIRNATYLERDDGKRLYLMDYRPPQDDGLGAKFVFQRMVDDKPFLNSPKGSVRFYSEVNSKLKLNVKYKLSDMLIDGKLEY